MISKRKQTPRKVLLLRIASIPDLATTDKFPSLVRDNWGEVSLLTLVSNKAEGISVIKADERFDQVVSFSINASESDEINLKGLRKNLKQLGVTDVIVCIGVNPEPYHLKLFAIALLCPGRKWQMIKNVQIKRLKFDIIKVILALFARGLFLRLAALYCRRKKQVLLEPKFNEDEKAPNLVFPVNNVRKILWIRLDGLGDIIMGLPAMEALRNAYPNADIHMLVRPQSVGVVSLLPWVKRIFECEGWDAPLTTRSPFSTKQFLSLLLKLRGEAYDLVVEPSGRPQARLMSLLSKGRWRVTPSSYIDNIDPHYSPDNPSLSFCTHIVDIQAVNKWVYEGSCEFISALGVKVSKERYVFPSRTQEQDTIERMRQREGLTLPMVVIHAHASDPMRDWSNEKWVQFIREVSEQRNWSFVLTGTKLDYESNQEIVDDLKTLDVKVVNWSGQLQLSELFALFQKSVLTVTVDTGPMHISSICGIPTVALMVPKYAVLHAPYKQMGNVVQAQESGFAHPLHQDSSLKSLTELESVSVKDVLDKVLALEI